MNVPGERWFEYRCVECDPSHNPIYGLPFVMLLPDNDDEVPDGCPRCGSYRSLMLGNEREVVLRHRGGSVMSRVPIQPTDRVREIVAAAAAAVAAAIEGTDAVDASYARSLDIYELRAGIERRLDAAAHALCAAAAMGALLGIKPAADAPPTDDERVEHVSDAYADVSAALGIERLRLSRTMRGSPHHQEQAWRVERLERVHEDLRAALVGTPRERATPEQIRALQAEAREAADRHAAIADEHARFGLQGPPCS